jgi:hypothetical protein
MDGLVILMKNSMSGILFDIGTFVYHLYIYSSFIFS